MLIQEDEFTDLNEDDVIGMGASGKVYKIILGNGQTVAVKKLINWIKDETPIDSGFKAEVRLYSIHRAFIYISIIYLTNDLKV
jgi:hypothetical protein